MPSEPTPSRDASSDPGGTAAYRQGDAVMRLRGLDRLLDANVNRAREALRTMEEAARFLLDDADLAADLKAVRHDLQRLVADFAAAGADLLAARDVGGDVGTAITTPAESNRPSPAAVAAAAGGRLTEALRALEEYGKLLDPAAATRTERMRYTAYALEQRLGLALRRAGRSGATPPPPWRLCVLVTEAACRGDWRTVAEAAIGGGAECLQLREKHLDGDELLRRARTLVALAAGRASVIVNDRVDVALAADADGVHVGQGDLPLAAVRRLDPGRRLLVGVSTSTAAEALAAADADYCGVGPMFASPTKDKPRIAGPARMTAFVREADVVAASRGTPPMPHLAIGGITADNVHEVVAAGARGIAVTAAVCGADDPQAAARTLVEAVAAGASADGGGGGARS